MHLYRIAYVSDSEGRSVVRELAAPPVAGDQISLDARTLVTVREVVPRNDGGTIAAEVIVELSNALGDRMSAAESAPAVGAEPGL